LVVAPQVQVLAPKVQVQVLAPKVQGPAWVQVQWQVQVQVLAPQEQQVWLPAWVQAWVAPSVQPVYQNEGAAFYCSQLNLTHIL
jgi:hypothetical protein